MDTLMLAKCRRWVGAYPGPFHSLPVQQITRAWMPLSLVKKRDVFSITSD